MYMMFSNFKHPIYDGKMPMKKYIEALSNPKIDFSSLDLSPKVSLVQKFCLKK